MLADVQDGNERFKKFEDSINESLHILAERMGYIETEQAQNGAEARAET